ncbi:MAG: response regulator transcription factor [Calditrichaeota bacterium]|nr:response regulator transcription factor [Calditrichota bacterium]MCB0303006.1 response regulator transcription factor [Calditrichota bacterium]MCB9090824.1 response regulator transcription factor [Calditrichia bacterium]
MRILIVEDDIKLAKNLQSLLTREGYVVHLAHDGMQAWESAYVENYNLIVLDINLPKMDGLTVLKHLREENIATPVILLTARNQLEDKIAGLDSGADDYLPKPFATPELLARIRALLRRNTPVNSPVITVDKLKVNTLSHEVWVNEETVSLTPREYGILELLLFNMNRVVSRLSIAEHVWDDNFDLMTNVVDVHIRNLRKKLCDDGNQLIATVWGIGYIIKKTAA